MALVSALALLINAPILLMVVNSFQTTDQMMASHSVVPEHATIVNYAFLLARTPFVTFFANSFVIAALSTVLTVIGAALAGYALSRWQARLLAGYARGLLMVQMFPIIMALIPLFIIFRMLGLIDNPLSVILVYAAVHLPFATWMFRSFIDAIPRELDEAALVDGCTRLSAFVRVILPLAGPGTAAVTVFSFLFSYNEFFVASVFLRTDRVMTVPVGVQMFMQQYATDWGSLMAAATATMVPAFIFFLFVQKYVAAGAIEGGVKG
ncbi:MAG TPA: carbohydrate ABC transporter permease [Acetobacteraceae bacterium]|nr:carbohydrate ABC transporter permease [Acetobacteraceae bacterium]